MKVTHNRRPGRTGLALMIVLSLFGLLWLPRPDVTAARADSPATTGIEASGRTPRSDADSTSVIPDSVVRRSHPLVILPTLVQQLAELRINTGKKAVLRDGTMNVVYVKKTPGKGHTFLNFHLEVTSDGPLTLRPGDLWLAPKASGQTGHTPVDWFLDVGLEEVRGDSLIVPGAGIVQFTTEVPIARIDSLTLSVAGQTVGTVAAIREGIRVRSGAGDRGEE